MWFSERTRFWNPKHPEAYSRAVPVIAGLTPQAMMVRVGTARHLRGCVVIRCLHVVFVFVCVCVTCVYFCFYVPVCSLACMHRCCALS